MTSIYVKEKAAQGTPTATYGQIWVENTVPASFHIEDDAGALAEVNVGTLIATTLTGTLSTAAQTNITSVGALNGGSITSGFGSIDNGSSTITTTGALSCGTFTSTGIDDNATGERLQIADTRIDVGTTGAGYQLRYVADDYSLGLFGGSGANCAQIYLYGGTTAAIAGDIQIRGGGANQLYYDDSASSWDFQANAITTTGTLTVGGNIYSTDNTDDTLIGGGNSTSAGSQMILYGGAHATNASDVIFRSDGFVTELQHDNSASIWDFQANAIITTGTATFSGKTIFANTTLTTDNQFYADALTATSPIIGFDANDWFGYSRTDNIFNFQVNGATQLEIGDGDIDCKDCIVTWSLTTENQPFFNFVATEDADAISAISSLTFGTTGGHIQIDINGTKRWIRYYDSIS
jgi:hypothetical protein